MADILRALGKSKKAALPPSWMEGISKKHPDIPFYFNEDTGHTSWTLPDEQENKKKSVHKSKKRKSDEVNSEEFSDASPSIAQQLLNNITQSKLNVKMKNARGKKDGVESTSQKNAKTDDAVQKESVKDLELSKSQRSSSVESSSTSESDCSNVTSTSSMGAKITRAVISASKAASPYNEKPDEASQITKMSKVSEIDRVNHRNSNEDACTNNSRKIYRKNITSERISTMKKTLNEQTNLFDIGVDDEKLSNKSRFHDTTSQDSQTRLLYLERRVLGNCLLGVINYEKQENKDNNYNQNLSILEKINPFLYCYDEMEWESIEDEKIISEVYIARLKVYEKSIDAQNEISFNNLNAVNMSVEKNALYIVIDTNVFLLNLPFIEEVRDSNFDIFGRPFIVIPWTVLQELHFLKNDKNNTKSQALKYKARKAIEFLNQHFITKHPRFLGQTPADVEENKNKYMIECPNDEILQTCLQVKESEKSPVLLSYDKSFSSKAMLYSIPVLGQNDSLEKIYFLKTPTAAQFLDNSLHAHIKKKQDTSILQEELNLADDIMENGKAVLKSVLSQVVAKEMETVFGTRWEKHCIICPPWTVVTVLKCALKHWMAAISESFERRTELMLCDLQLYITIIPENGRKLKDVKIFLHKCIDIFQTLNNKKYPTFKNKVISQINDLMQKCLHLINEINNKRLYEFVGSVEEHEEEQRASLAFKVFEEIYDYARDTCGIVSDTIGLQCAFVYNKFNSSLTPQLALQQQLEISISVNKLLEILSVILSNDRDNMCPSYKEIISLYDVLIHFLPSWNCDELLKLTPMDVYCCIKLKRQILEKGYQQLRDLVVHFCRIANFQCK